MSETYKIRQEAGGVGRAKIKVYFETYADGDKVYQNFRLVGTSDKFIKYFTDDKFRGYNVLSDKMEDYFVGDGENIFFLEKMYHGNLISVIYEKATDVEIPEEYRNGQFEVSTKIPATLGCYDCTHFRKKNKKCMYYSIIGIDIRTNCKDFRQK